MPLLEALQASDCTEVANLAHRLAGSCASLGFSALADSLRALEEAALAADIATLQRLEAPFLGLLQRSRILLQTLTAG
ncbi:Hpt domain protein [compost metagenome]